MTRDNAIQIVVRVIASGDAEAAEIFQALAILSDDERRKAIMAIERQKWLKESYQPNAA